MTVNINVQVNPYYRGTVSLDGNQYQLVVHWNTYQEQWNLDIKGISNDVDAKGIAILTGRDLFQTLGQYDLGTCIVQDNSEANNDPTYDDMGGRFTLVYTPLTE